MIYNFYNSTEEYKQQAISLLEPTLEGFEDELSMADRLAMYDTIEPNDYVRCYLGIYNNKVVSVVLVETYALGVYGITSWAIKEGYSGSKTGLEPIVAASRDFNGSLYCQVLDINESYISGLLTDKVYLVDEKEMRKVDTESVLGRFSTLISA